MPDTVRYLIRSTRKDIQTLKQHLHGLGADHIFTYDELANKSLSSQIKEITGKKSIRLFLNCVGGRDTQAMAKFLGTDAHMISYGGMSKQPVSLPVSLHIFKNLTSHGFWQAKWYQTHSRDERQALVDRLTQMIAEGKASPYLLSLHLHAVDTSPSSYKAQMPKSSHLRGTRVMHKSLQRYMM
jgi:trans-2-enoyl-CoA reductase